MFTIPFEPAVCEVSSIYIYLKRQLRRNSQETNDIFSMLLKSSSRWKAVLESGPKNKKSQKAQN